MALDAPASPARDASSDVGQPRSRVEGRGQLRRGSGSRLDLARGESDAGDAGLGSGSGAGPWAAPGGRASPSVAYGISPVAGSPLGPAAVAGAASTPPSATPPTSLPATPPSAGAAPPAGLAAPHHLHLRGASRDGWGRVAAARGPRRLRRALLGVRKAAAENAIAVLTSALLAWRLSAAFGPGAVGLAWALLTVCGLGALVDDGADVPHSTLPFAGRPGASAGLAVGLAAPAWAAAGSLLAAAELLWGTNGGSAFDRRSVAQALAAGGGDAATTAASGAAAAAAAALHSRAFSGAIGHLRVSLAAAAAQVCAIALGVSGDVDDAAAADPEAWGAGGGSGSDSDDQPLAHAPYLASGAAGAAQQHHDGGAAGGLLGDDAAYGSGAAIAAKGARGQARVRRVVSAPGMGNPADDPHEFAGDHADGGHGAAGGRPGGANGGPFRAQQSAPNLPAAGAGAVLFLLLVARARSDAGSAAALELAVGSVAAAAAPLAASTFAPGTLTLGEACALGAGAVAVARSLPAALEAARAGAPATASAPLVLGVALPAAALAAAPLARALAPAATPRARARAWAVALGAVALALATVLPLALSALRHALEDPIAYRLARYWIVLLVVCLPLMRVAARWAGLAAPPLGAPERGRRSGAAHGSKDEDDAAVVATGDHVSSVSLRGGGSVGDKAGDDGLAPGGGGLGGSAALPLSGGGPGGTSAASLRAAGGVPLTVVRKGYHVLVLAMFIPGALSSPAFLGLAFAAALAAMVWLEAARLAGVPVLAPAVEALAAPFADARDRAGSVYVTPIALLLGCAVPTWLAVGAAGGATAVGASGVGDLGGALTGASGVPPSVDPRVAAASLAGVVLVGAGDAAASAVGSAFGRTRLCRDGPKTLEGLVGGVLASVATWSLVAFVAPAFGLAQPAALAAKAFVVVSGASAAACALEAVTSQLDNVFVPLQAYALIAAFLGGKRYR